MESLPRGYSRRAYAYYGNGWRPYRSHVYFGFGLGGGHFGGGHFGGRGGHHGGGHHGGGHHGGSHH
ncbi:hypothetical protein E2493_02870 [Sphingomonas parva]|uniref:Uncharacterized protein n=1 Tax=Sphingomonas parva TaxID=2555898 RepID=A0A4Y8ZX63_9SPHN|nr:hypothetical protein E2493_02870 [Sphingomonas parva]